MKNKHLILDSAGYRIVNENSSIPSSWRIETENRIDYDNKNLEKESLYTRAYIQIVDRLEQQSFVSTSNLTTLSLLHQAGYLILQLKRIEHKRLQGKKFSKLGNRKQLYSLKEISLKNNPKHFSLNLNWNTDYSENPITSFWIKQNDLDKFYLITLIIKERTTFSHLPLMLWHSESKERTELINILKFNDNQYNNFINEYRLSKV